MTGPLAMRPTVAVDWDHDGTFTGVHDDVTADVADSPGLEIDGGRDGIRVLSPPKVQAGAFELLNGDGTYSQHRADSPLYQRILPGRSVQYRATLGTADIYDAATPYDEPDYYDGLASWPLGEQLIDDLSQRTAWGDRRVGIRTIGHEVLLTDSVVSIPVQTNLRTDQCAALVLDAAGWPADRRQIATSDTTLAWWWADDRRPWDALLELMASEGPGTFYVDRGGDFHWEGRNYRTITPRSTTARAVYCDRSLPGGLWFTRFEYNPGYDAVYNQATYATKRRAPLALAPVWKYGTALTFGANERRIITARPSDPVINAQVPGGGVDYSISSGTISSMTLRQTAGATIGIDIVAGPGGMTIDSASGSTGIQLRAQALTVVSEQTVQNSVNAAASIAKYSPIPGQNIPLPLPLPGWPEVEPGMAIGVCDAWVTRYQETRPTVTIALRNVNLAHVTEIVSRAVSDRVTIVEANTGLDRDAWINMQRLSIGGPQGIVTELTLMCEVCDTVAGAVWDTAVWNHPSAIWGT